MFGDTCTFVMDLDLKYKEKYTTRRYTNETIQEVISLSISVLS